MQMLLCYGVFDRKRYPCYCVTVLLCYCVNENMDVLIDKKIDEQIDED